MSVEKPLDLSKVTVANLLNDDAPANAGVLNEKAEVVETTEPESDVEVEETVVEPVVEESSVTATEATDEEPGVIQILKEKLGYEIEGEFNEDYDGIVEFTRNAATEIAKEQLDTMFSQFPDVAEYLQYRYNGGDPRQYFQAHSPEVDYTAVQISEDNLSVQRHVVEKWLSLQGFEPQEIQETVQEYLDAGILGKQAERNLKKLQDYQTVQAQQVVEQQKLQAQQQQQQVQQQWNNIKSTIDKGVLRGFNVPESEKNKFFNWMSQPVDNQGRTQRMMQREALDIETQVALEYLLYKNFDLNKLVQSTKNTVQAQNLKQRLQQSQPATKRMKGGGAGYTKPVELPTLNELL